MNKNKLNNKIFSIRTLDLSFNNIKKIDGLTTLIKLEKLYLLSNKIKKVMKLILSILILILTP